MGFESNRKDIKTFCVCLQQIKVIRKFKSGHPAVAGGTGRGRDIKLNSPCTALGTMLHK